MNRTGDWFRRAGRGLRAVLFRMPTMITCGELEAFVLDYIEGDLPAAKRRVFERHLRVCPECRRYLDAYRRTVELGRAAFAEPHLPVPEDVPADLVQAILEARRQPGDRDGA